MHEDALYLSEFRVGKLLEIERVEKIFSEDNDLCYGPPSIDPSFSGPFLNKIFIVALAAKDKNKERKMRKLKGIQRQENGE